YDGQARAEAGAVARIEVESTSVWDRFFQAVATLGPLTVVGYEAHVLSVEDAERFVEAGKPWRWKPTKHLVERLRAAKDAGEVAAIRSAAELAGEGLRRTLTQVRAGLTELEVAGILEGTPRRLGSEGHPFPTIVAAGPRSALPHARSSRRGGGADRAGRLRRGARRRADRRRRPCVGRGTGSVIGRSYGTSRTRVDFGSMNLDIIAQLVQILKDAPELGAIEVRRGLLGR